MPLKIMIADDHPILVDGVSSVIGEIENVIVLPPASSGRQLLSKLRNAPADLILLDLNMPQMDGLETLKILKKEFPEIRVIIFTSYTQPELLRDVKKLQADGYLVKNSSSEILKKAILAVASGKKWFQENPHQNPDTFSDRDEFLKKYQITKREVEIIRNIAEGFTSREISEKLFVSEFTINAHRRNICRKLNIYTSVGLLNFAREHSLI